jgi:hypothetical protein
MIANRIRMRRPRFILGAGLLFILGSCSSESTMPTGPLEIDEPGSISGELAVYIASFDDGTSETRYFLRDAKGDERRLRFDGPPEIDPGTRLRVWGSASGDTFEVSRFTRAVPVPSSEIGTATSELIGVPPQPPRVMCVAQVVMNGGPPADNLSVEAIEQQFHVGPKSVNAYYQENSYGKNSLGGKTYGPLPYQHDHLRYVGLGEGRQSDVHGARVYRVPAILVRHDAQGNGLRMGRPGTGGDVRQTGQRHLVQQYLGLHGHRARAWTQLRHAALVVDHLHWRSVRRHPGRHGRVHAQRIRRQVRHVRRRMPPHERVAEALPEVVGRCNAIRVRSSGTFNIYPTETPIPACNDPGRVPAARGALGKPST